MEITFKDNYFKIETGINENVSKLYYDNGLFYYDEEPSDFSDFLHLYILSDQPIKEGDWCIYIDQDCISGRHPFTANDIVCNMSVLNKNIMKIIASTNKELGLPLIPEILIKRFVNIKNYEKSLEMYNLLIESKLNDFKEFIDKL